MKFRIIIDKEKEEEIIARVHKKTHLIDEIEAFYIEDGKTYASYADQKKYLVKMHLYELEAILPNHFQKINKSNIANMKHIVRFRTSLNGDVDAEFKSGFSDYISRRCFAELKRRYSL